MVGLSHGREVAVDLVGEEHAGADQLAIVAALVLVGQLDVQRVRVSGGSILIIDLLLLLDLCLDLNELLAANLLDVLGSLHDHVVDHEELYLELLRLTLN